MESLTTIISNTPMLAVFLALALGYLIGLIKIGNVTVGATIGTLVAAFVISRFISFSIPGILTTIFSVLFCFTLGYEAGPAFFKSLRSQGLKYVLHAVVFSAVSLAVLVLFGLTGVVSFEELVGIAAGALTQTSILTVADNSAVAYAVTYLFGTVLAIVFASVIAPRLIRTDLTSAAKNNIKRNKTTVKGNDNNPRMSSMAVRAYIVEKGSDRIDRTVEDLEDAYAHILEVEKIHRNDTLLDFSQETVIQEGDIITVIGAPEKLIALDDEYLRETGERKYVEAELVTEDIVLVDNFDGSIIDYLSAFGVVLRNAEKNGRSIPITETMSLAKGTFLKVSGVKSSVKRAADKLGYIREVGDATDVPFIFAALAIAVIIGAVKISKFSLGDSTCALLVGLLCGWYCNKNPKVGAYPSGTRWFMKSVGLNIFIAVKGLTTGSIELNKHLLVIVGIGFAVTLLPHIITLLIGKYLLRMDDADNLGCACGSGTCTAALNAISDSAGSTVFVTGFATSNAVANITLTVVGVLLAAVM